MPETTYCTLQHLMDRKDEERLAKITGDGSGQTVDQMKVEGAIEDFAGYMNAELRKQYPDLPFDDTQSYLNGLNIQGAWLLLERDSDAGWSEGDREDWKMLMKQVEGLADADLRTETDEEQEAMTEGYFSSDRGVFGRNNGLAADYE